ncbi:MAG: signal peptidase II [Verrucomicrobiaceae bacterium]|nr:signal peptidase II [Verrucomicrobiaceae bacterium]
MPLLLRKARVFWPLLSTLLLSDCATKRWAETHLVEQSPKPVVGDLLRWTLVYNQAGAMGIAFGRSSRPILILATLIALVALARIYRAADSRDAVLAAAVALVVGGALGNLMDRVRWAGGVVDFIDVGVGASRFWVFNLADTGVTIGAALLAWLLLRRQKQTPAQV